MGYDNKIVVSTYDNGRPCVSVETPDCGRCLMEVIDVLVEEGEYLLNDKLVKLD